MAPNGDGPVGRPHDAVTGDDLLHAVGAPACNTGRGEQRREHVLRDAQHGIHQPGVHIHVGTHGRIAVTPLLHQRDAQLLHLLQQVELRLIALDLGNMPGVLLQQHRTGIRHGVHSVAQAVELAGAIPGLPV